jgi:transcriptional regulator with XRE-family HTH domain
MNFGVRLAEERKRLRMRQAEFAARVGTDAAKQSLYENGRRELRGDYLARLAEAGVDAVYILTGRRSDSAWLGEGANRLLADYLTLPDSMQQVVEDLARTLRDQMTPSPTLHGRKAGYRVEDSG